MRTIKTKYFGRITAAVLLLASSFALGQDGPPPMHAGMGGHDLHFLSRYLDLSDAQKTQIKQLRISERSATEPLMQQAHEGHVQMTELVQSGNFDETKAQTIAASLSQTDTQLMVQHAKVEAAIFQLLTPDQKAKLTQLTSQRKQRFDQHMQRLQQGDQPQTPNN
jgi:protein CpxP